MSYNLRKRVTLPVRVSRSSCSSKLKVNFPRLGYDVWKHICDFLHPCFIHLLLKPSSSESSSSTNVVPLLPIELLISWNNPDMLDEFKHVLLSYNFRKTLASKVARFGNYQTMLWFQMNGLTLNESVLVSAAQRGDRQLFESIWEDIEEVEGSFYLCLDAFKGAAQFGHLDFLKYAECTLQLMIRTLRPYDTDVTFTVLQAASKHGH